MADPNTETAEITAEVKVEEKKVETITETVVTTTTTGTIEIVSEEKKEVETTKIVEEPVKENVSKDNEPETPDPIYKGNLYKHHPNKILFGKNQRHFELSEEPIPKDNFSVYWKKNIKDVPTKAPPTKSSSETTKHSSEPTKPSSEPEKTTEKTDVPASDVPVSDVPASDVPASDVPASDVPASDVPASDVPASDVPASDVPASDVPASDVPASDVPASDVPECKDDKEEQKEKESNQYEEINKVHFCNIAHATQTGKGLLFYYKNEKTREPSGIINLKGATVESDNTSTGKFKIITQDKKEHILEALSEKAKKRWVHTIGEEIKQANEQDTDALYASEEYKKIYDQLVKGKFIVKETGAISDSDLLSDSEDKQGKLDSKRRSIFPNFVRPRKTPETPATPETSNATEPTTEPAATYESESKNITVNTDGVNTADVSPDDGPTKSPKSTKSGFFNLPSLFAKKEKTPEIKDESAKDKEIPQETKDVGTSDTPAAAEDTIATDTKPTDETKDETKDEIKDETKEETKEEKKKGTSLFEPVFNAFANTFKTTKEEKTVETTTTSEAETSDKPEAIESAPEEQKTGAEPSKDEETPEKPKEEPTKKITNLGRRITSVFKKKPEKAPGDDDHKDDETEEDKKRKRISMQKKRSGSQSEEKESETVHDEFELVQAEVAEKYPDATKQGKLNKESHSFFKRPEERYFALHGGILYYFKDSKTKRQIKIEKNCQVRKADNRKFEVETPSKKIYKFQAPSEDEQSEWVNAIQDHINKLPEEETTDKKELPEVTNVSNSEGIQEAIDEAANASKESAEPSTEPSTEPKTENDIAEKSEITPAAPETTATA